MHFVAQALKQRMVGEKSDRRLPTLKQVEVVHSPKIPRTGQIMLMNSAWEFSKRGRNRAMVIMVEDGLRYNSEGEMVSNVPNISLALDYTRTKRYPLHRITQQWFGVDESAALMKSESATLAFSNIRANKGNGKPIDELLDTEKRETAIILFTGPSLQHSAKMLESVDRSKAAIIALNSSVLALPDSITADYHFGIDRGMLPEWGVNNSDTIGVFHPQAPPELCSSGYRAVYFFGQPGRGITMNAMRAQYSDYLEGVAELEQGGNVGPSAVHFAYMMGFRNIVMLGLDVCWEGHKTHWRENVNKDNLRIDRNAIMIDTGERFYLTRIEYLKAFHMTVGAAYFLREDGIGLYNCSEFGPFYNESKRVIPATRVFREDIYGNEYKVPAIESVPFCDILNLLKIGR